MISDDEAFLIAMRHVGPNCLACKRYAEPLWQQRGHMVKWRERLLRFVNGIPQAVFKYSRTISISFIGYILLFGLCIFTPESADWPIMTAMAILCLDGILEDGSVRVSQK